MRDVFCFVARSVEACIVMGLKKSGKTRYRDFGVGISVRVSKEVHLVFLSRSNGSTLRALDMRL